MYPGGKNGAGVYQKLINLIPPHDVYIEPFLGSGAVMRLKRPAVASIGIDADPEAVRNFSACVPGLRLAWGDAVCALGDYKHIPECVDIDPARVLVYADPPYLFSTRASKDRLYHCEFGAEAEHIRLLEILRALPCMVMVSGYDSPLYRRILHDWRVASFPAQTRSGRTAMEFVWLNFPEPVALHDYRYLGDNFREREKINRRKKRWKARLAKMSSLERLATLAALTEFLDGVE